MPAVASGVLERGPGLEKQIVLSVGSIHRAGQGGRAIDNPSRIPTRLSLSLPPSHRLSPRDCSYVPWLIGKWQGTYLPEDGPILWGRISRARVSDEWTQTETQLMRLHRETVLRPQMDDQGDETTREAAAAPTSEMERVDVHMHATHCPLSGTSDTRRRCCRLPQRFNLIVLSVAFVLVVLVLCRFETTRVRQSSPIKHFRRSEFLLLLF